MKINIYLFCCILIIFSFWFIGRPKAKIHAIPPNYSLYLDECCGEECLLPKCEGAYDTANNECDIAISLSKDEICSDPDLLDCFLSVRYDSMGCVIYCEGDELIYECIDDIISKEQECKSFGSGIIHACDIPAKVRKDEEDEEAGFCG